MKHKFIPLLLLSFLFFGSCSTPKDVVYFEGIDQLTPEQIQEMAQRYKTYICADDMLTITVTSSDSKSVLPFNPPMFSYTTPSKDKEILEATHSPTMLTYLVDRDGYVDFPVLGRIHAAGLTKQELAGKIKGELSDQVKDPQVRVEIINFKVTVIGEVTLPSTIDVKTDRISIMDALGEVGDLTINGNRTNVLIIRETNGELEYGRIDLSKPDVFASPYYYLKQNDVVYVEPNRAKKRNANYSQAEQYTVTVFSSIISTVSVMTSVVLAILNSRK